MKKIVSTLLSIAIFSACTKEKAIPPQQQDIKSENNSNIATTSVKQLTVTSENEEDMVKKKKVAKIKYPKQKAQKK